MGSYPALQTRKPRLRELKRLARVTTGQDGDSSVTLPGVEATPQAAGPEGTARRPWSGWSCLASTRFPARCPLPQAPAGWVTNLPWCARDIPGFNTTSPASRETPRFQTDLDSGSPVLQVAQPGAPGTIGSLERGQWTVRCPPQLHTWLHAHLHPGRKRIADRKANSSAHRALRSTKTTPLAPGQPRRAEHREGGDAPARRARLRELARQGGLGPQAETRPHSLPLNPEALRCGASSGPQPPVCKMGAGVCWRPGSASGAVPTSPRERYGRLAKKGCDSCK